MKGWTLSRFYHLSWALLLCLALSLTALSELVPLYALIAAALFSFWCLVPPGRFRRLPAPHLIVRLLGISALVVPAGFQYSADKDLASLLGTCLWACVFLFLPRKQKPFGHWIAILVVGLIALMTVIVKQEFSTHLVFLLFLLLLIFTLNANNLFALAGNSGSARYRLGSRYFVQLIPALGWGGLGGALVFFLFPRTQLLSNPWGLKERENSTGYTGRISLEAGTIREDSSLALTVESDGTWLKEKAKQVYFRGNTLDRFDGVNWTSTEMERWYYRVGEDVRFSLVPAGQGVPVRLFREPHSTPAILYPDVLIFLKAPEHLLGGIRFDAARSLFRTGRGSLRYAYEAVVAEPAEITNLSDLSIPELERRWERERNQVRPGERSVVPDLRYLQVPSEVASSDYFNGWVREVVDKGTGPTVGAVVAKLDTNFVRRFSPTLVHESGSQGSPLKSFLGEARRGHCEYFATAAALYLRNRGIPTRIVLGYRGGTFNAVSNALEVRERNAHAWVEIYGGHGRWYRYDPTPSFPLGDEGGALARVTEYYSALKFWFNRYIVHYNTSAQQEVYSQVAFVKHRSVGVVNPQRSFLRAIALLVALGTARWLARRWIRRRRDRRESLPEYYRLFLKRLARAGLAPKAGETLSAFHKRAADAGFDPFSLRRMDVAIHRDLYSPRPLQAAELRELALWVRQSLFVK